VKLEAEFGSQQIFDSFYLEAAQIYPQYTPRRFHYQLLNSCSGRTASIEARAIVFELQTRIQHESDVGRLVVV
jgi:hypothetical protein